MEAAGIAVDPRELDDLARECDATAERLQREIYDFAGENFNIGSPQQLGTILFEKLGIPSGGRTKTGYATGSEVLLGLARDYPICAKVLEYREVTKLKNTYIDVLPKLVGNDGRLRTIFNQTTTATGRLSSTNPNLQNIPVRSELGRRIRRAFVAGGADRLLLAADYSQIELRIMAHLSGDRSDAQRVRRGDDIHDFTARGLFAVPPDDAADRESAPDREVGQLRLALRDERFRFGAAVGDLARRGQVDHRGLFRPLPLGARLHRAQSWSSGANTDTWRRSWDAGATCPICAPAITRCAPRPSARPPMRRCKGAPPIS